MSIRGVGGGMSGELMFGWGKGGRMRRARLVPCKDGEHPLSSILPSCA